MPQEMPTTQQERALYVRLPTDLVSDMEMTIARSKKSGRRKLSFRSLVERSVRAYLPLVNDRMDEDEQGNG